MGLSRSVKISILLAIDSAFFLVELIAGYAVGSLALVADSFHMLNDVMSLIVALYAIKLTQNSVASSKYSYGWHRAEILAALINGVFLLALCFSIFIEAIERFFSVPEVSNPRLVVIVGSFGLISNIFGLFLFHEHGHSHSHSESASHTPSIGVKAIHTGTSTPQLDTSPLLPSRPNITVPHSKGSVTDGAAAKPRLSASHRRSDSLSRPRHDSNASLGFYPAQVRASLVQVAEEMRTNAEGAGDNTSDFASASPRKRGSVPAYMTQSAPALGEGGSLEEVLRRAAAAVDEESYSRAEEGRNGGTRNDVAAEIHDSDDEDDDHDHGHSHDHAAKSAGGHGGHSHADMNMQAVLLHVMGDALGNIGVIATGLIIWLTSWQYKYYCDPAISLVITMIIFSSAMPLVRSASFILLQGVPTSVSLEAVSTAITRIPGVLSVHELHIWQLSETKIVASVHVLVKKSHKPDDTQHKEGPSGKDLVLAPGSPGDYHKGNGQETAYMSVASEIRRVLHDYGIHSSTIQPEYVMDGVDDEAISVRSGCLIPCMTDAECDPANACCPPVAVAPRSVE